MLQRRTLFGMLLLAATLMMAGCADHGVPSTSHSRSVSGYAKGIKAGGVVTAYKLDANGNIVLPPLGQAITDASGHYMLDIGTYFGPLSLQVSGNYTDEATGQPAVIDPAHPLVVAMVPPDDATPLTMSITTLTNIAYTQALSLPGGLIANINAINDLVGKCFQLGNILTTRPMDASAALPLSASDFEKQYALVLAAVSQIAKSNLSPGTTNPTAAQLSVALDITLTDLKGQLPADSTSSALGLQTTIAAASMAFLDPANTLNHTGLTQNDPSLQNVLVAARTVSGYASKGIIKNGTVTAYKIDAAGNKIQPLLAQTTTNDAGFYSLSIGAYYGPISIEVSGNYKDEATGQTATIAETAPLKAATVPPSDATAITVNVTALTKIAFDQTIHLAESRATDFTASINAINLQVSSSFQVPDILTTKPLDSSTTLPATASAAEKQYTLVLAAVSQIAANNLPANTVTAAVTAQQLATALASAVTTLVAQLPTGGAAATSLQITVATAATKFINNPTINTTGITATDTAVQPILAANTNKNVVVTIALRNPATSVPVFGAVHGSLTLPTGMSCKADGVTGELQSSTMNALQSGSLVNGLFNASTRTLTVQAIRAAGLSLGDLLAVTCVMPSTLTPLIGDFTVSSALDVNNGGVSFAGFTLVVSSVR